MKRALLRPLRLATVLLVFELGRHLYGARAGLVAAAILALMPYHVAVTRQVLLDGPQTFFLTPTVNVDPAMNGPAALPSAETLTAIPFSVPKILRLDAEFVRRMVMQGNAKTET